VRPRLFAFDLDGTLLDPTGVVSARTAAAVRRTRDAGNYVVLATGRPPMLAGPTLRELGGSPTHGVMANGTVICTFGGDNPDGDVLHIMSYPTSTGRRLVERVRAVEPGCGFALGTDAGFVHERGFENCLPAPPGGTEVADVLTTAGGELYKLIVFHPELGAMELMERLSPVMEEGFAVHHLGVEAVEIGPAGQDKSTGLRWLCVHLGVEAADVIAFGDNVNDEAMLAFAGVGVAMQNAPASTLAVAQVVAPSNTHDGVAVVLEQLLDDLT
jgi:hydroxymethylpyrimidine pyrophosphatase-like HAD family hydrolase